MIAEELVRNLVRSDAIEVGPELIPEAELDVQAVLKMYLRTDRDMTTRARELAESGRGSFSSIKKRLAFEANFKLGDEGVDYIVDQLLEAFMMSHNIEEIFADDLELRLQMAKVVKKHTVETENNLDEAVRKKIKNLSEGSVSWDAEYDRVMSRLKSKA
jgi:hypothetical protein